MTELTQSMIQKHCSFEATSKDIDNLQEAFSWCNRDKELFEYICGHKLAKSVNDIHYLAWAFAYYCKYNKEKFEYICGNEFATSAEDVERLARDFRDCDFDKEAFEKIYENKITNKITEKTIRKYNYTTLVDICGEKTQEISALLWRSPLIIDTISSPDGDVVGHLFWQHSLENAIQELQEEIEGEVGEQIKAMDEILNKMTTNDVEFTYISLIN